MIPIPGLKPERCRFASRCPYCTDACLSCNPKLTDMGGGQQVACLKCQ
ncbi:hypothetical protein [Lacrimispora sp. 210928-DFI.3.58]|nr:hypothetical protein [Lacrimispora sp. 210928-DFI.3.58]